MFFEQSGAFKNEFKKLGIPSEDYDIQNNFGETDHVTDLFQWLRDNNYLCSVGERYNQPTQKAMEMGLFEMTKTTINKPSGETIVSATTKVTGKGQIYFVNKFLYINQNDQ